LIIINKKHNFVENIKQYEVEETKNIPTAP